jgi:hypothetical protein
MSPLRGIKDAIVGLAERLDRLDVGVRGETAPARSTQTKRIPMFESVAFVFPLTSGLPIASTFSPQEQHWTNGADDAYITEVTYSAYVVQSSGIEFTQMWATERGMVVSSFGGQAGIIFDFEWNYRREGSRQMYGTNERGGKYLSRKSLGNGKRDQMLRFTDPELVNAGDTLVWMVSPTAFSPGSVGAAPAAGSVITTIVLNVIMNGYRDGAMAVADYDRTAADVNPRGRMG